MAEDSDLPLVDDLGKLPKQITLLLYHTIWLLASD